MSPVAPRGMNRGGGAVQRQTNTNSNVYKDKSKPDDIRQSNMVAAKGLSIYNTNNLNYC